MDVKQCPVLGLLKPPVSFPRQARQSCWGDSAKRSRTRNSSCERIITRVPARKAFSFTHRLFPLPRDKNRSHISWTLKNCLVLNSLSILFGQSIPIWWSVMSWLLGQESSHHRLRTLNSAVLFVLQEEIPYKMVRGGSWGKLRGQGLGMARGTLLVRVVVNKLLGEKTRWIRDQAQGRAIFLESYDFFNKGLLKCEWTHQNRHSVFWF